MRQVPQYLLIGRGRVARHIQHYFNLLQLPFRCWHRGESLDLLRDRSSTATHILLLISDQSIESFIASYLQHVNAVMIHFSGSVITHLAYGVHPLMTFSETLYDLSQYESMSFVVDSDAPGFEVLLPGINNKHYYLPKSAKAKYHALCVMSGNFSCMLWQKMFASSEDEFNFPREAVFPYLIQQTNNLLKNAETALTGPLVRNDTATIERNIAALEGDAFQDVYHSFVRAYSLIKETA